MSDAQAQTVELQFVCGYDLASGLIAWYGNGYHGFSHVDAVLPDGRLLGARSDAIGGAKPGVRIRPANYERWKRISRLRLPLSALQRQRWLDFLAKEVGDPYDDRAILGFLLGEKWHSPNTWICSALQTAALRAVGWIDDPGVPDEQVTPDTLHAICMSHGAQPSVA